MRKWKLVLALVCAAGLLTSPQPGMAKLTPLSQGAMDSFTAQRGISLAAEPLGLLLDLKTLCYGAGSGAFLSLCDIELKGSVEFNSSVRIDFTTEEDLFGDMGLSGIRLALDDVTVKIDHLTIGAIRVGTDPGPGASFGSIGINGLVQRITGYVYIYAR